MTKFRYGPRGGTAIARTLTGVALSSRRRSLVFDFRRISEDRLQAQQWLDRLDDMLALAYFRLRTEQGGMTPQRAWEVLGAPSRHPANGKFFRDLFERGQILDEYADDVALKEAEAADAQTRS